MGKGTGLSRGDRCRNERLDRLRSVVSTDRAIVAIDLADDKQAVVVTDHDSRVLARRRVRVRAWELGPTLEWARREAAAAGFVDVVVGCEPTGHRWRIVAQIAEGMDMAVVCVQPLLVGRAREAEDLTRDKTDDKDAVVIARLVSELRCYLPERPDEPWARLRQLGARRAALITQSTSCTQQIRDLLECAWPAALTAAAKPFDSKSWQAAVSVVLDRADGARLADVRSMGWSRFARAVTRELPRWEAQRWHTRIVRAVFDALNDHTGVQVQRAAALERAAMVFDDWHHYRRQLAEVEARMTAILDDLDLTALVTSIPGLSAVGAAQILAETGNPNRFTSPRALVKHAGLCPRENTSGNHLGTSRISARGRPGLRLAAWRAVWPALRTNPVYAARFEHLTTRHDNPLTSGQARTAICAALLRQLHVVVTRRVAWDPARAGTPQATALAA
jgi:transposase